MSNQDLTDFLFGASREIENEYHRIQKRAKEDPGTAGDQGEENWASLLKNWLPPIFQIVTKGRIIDSKGKASPQVDIIVLKPEYPKALMDKKLYLAGGVLAVFECKITLKSAHLSKFFQTVASIKNMEPLRSYRNIYEETNSPIFVGLLAHSSNWKNEELIESIGLSIYTNDLKHVTKPIEMPDLFCIADACCWIAQKSLTPHVNHEDLESGECIMTSYWSDQRKSHFKVADRDIAIPIATALKTMLHRLSKEHEGLRSLALYFKNAISSGGGGIGRYWPIKEIFSEHNVTEFKKIGRHPNYFYPEDFKYL
ncbi:DUF6602 domain-containing protein [Pedobacter sp.]